MPYRILLRRDLSQNWNYNDPVLMSGEPGYEMDNRKFKMGDGQTPWSQLPYYCGVTGPTGNTGPIGVTGPTGAFADFHVYDYEIHVSGVDGSDTLGDGNLLNPVASITKALTLIAASRKTIIIHPGIYTESPVIATTATVLTTYEPLGENTSIVGTVSTSVACTIIGLSIQNLIITTNSGVTNVINSTISGTLTKSGSASLTEIRNCSVITALNVTGSGIVNIDGGNPNFLTVNNAAANVIVKNTIACVTPSLVLGSLRIADSVVVALATHAVTSLAGSVISLVNCQFLNAALNNTASVSLQGFYSIINCVYNKPLSSLAASSGSGGTTNSISYSQYINADKFITQGGTSSQYVKGDGSLSSAPYKVFTALLTQSGSHDSQATYVGPSYGNNLTIGISYTIADNGVTADFTNVGAPNNNIGTIFIATGEVPADRGDDNTYLTFDGGAPVATVLENTIGNIWFTYIGPGIYLINSNNLFPLYKTAFFGQSYYNGNNAVITTLNSTLYEGNTDDYIKINAAADLGSGIQLYDGLINGVTIEIRVYN